MARRPRVSRRLVRGTVGIGVLLLVVELVSRSGLVDATSLPPASAVLATAAGLLADPEFLTGIGGTLAAAGLGLALATVLAVPIGLAIGSSRGGRVAGMTVVELLRPIPSVALIPPAVLLLGRGLDMKVALVAFASAWPILVNAVYGAREVDAVARDTARAYGMGAVSVLRRVVLPSAAPFVFTGMRVSAAIALIVAISAELVAGGGAGIGTWMLGVSQAGVPRELLYAAIVVTGVLGVLVNELMLAADRRLFAWHHARRGEAAP